MHAFATILPVLLILGLGVALVRWEFIGLEFTHTLNRLVYWIALPTLIVERY